jgi:hypothetical protein
MPDHALGLELELSELVSRLGEERRWGHQRRVRTLFREITALQQQLAELGEQAGHTRSPRFHGVKRAGSLRP